MTTLQRSSLLAIAASIAVVGLSACAPGGADAPAATESGAATTASAAPSASAEEHDHEDAEATEASAKTPRITLTYDGGLLVLDAASLDVVADETLAGFNRINGAGDGRHVLVSTTGGWAVLDAGSWSEPHGDHSHYYTAEPHLHPVLVEAKTPAHVVVHDELTTLFDDGTGEVTVIPTGEWTEIAEHHEVTPSRTYTTPAAHHGVAVADQSGNLFVTQGDENGRTGARLLDASDAELAASDECPGIHGETVVGELILAGCENGALLLHGDHFHKIAAPDAYGRIGNAFSAEDSAVVLGDYKTDKEGGIGLTQFSLIDTEAESLQVFDLGSEYTWRGLARGVDGSALILGTDGDLRVIDPATGQVQRTIEVIADWTVPEEWQTAHPALTEHRGYAYITEPATNTIYVVDYVTGAVTKQAQLPQTPNEIVVTAG